MTVHIRRYHDLFTAQVIHYGISFVGTSISPATREDAIADLQRQMAKSGVKYTPKTFIESDHRATQKILERSK